LFYDYKKELIKRRSFIKIFFLQKKVYFFRFPLSLQYYNINILVITLDLRKFIFLLRYVFLKVSRKLEKITLI